VDDKSARAIGLGASQSRALSQRFARRPVNGATPKHHAGEFSNGNVAYAASGEDLMRSRLIEALHVQHFL